MVIDKFGILAIRNAWYDASKVTDHVLQGYTKVTTNFRFRVLIYFTISDAILSLIFCSHWGPRAGKKPFWSTP